MTAPAPTADPIAPPPPAPRVMKVSVHTGSSYERIGQVPDYVSCSVTWQYLGVGSGELVVGEDDPIAPYLLSVDQQVVAVVVDVGLGTRWGGRVAKVLLEREGPVGTGVLTAILVDDWIWLQKMLASQNGSNPSVTGMPQFDTRTGPAVGVAADYINAAATRLAVPVIASKPPVDGSASVSLNARMTPLSDLLTDPLRWAGVTMPATIWLPTDPQPADLITPLTSPTVVFAPRVLADKPWLQWTDSMTNISSVALQATQPSAYRAILGLSGSDAARIYDQVTDSTLATSLGAFGLPETYADASDAVLGTQSLLAGVQALAEVAGTASASFEIADAAPFAFGVDGGYVVGDMATVGVSGSSWRQRITKVTATDTRDGGLVFNPIIGEAPGGTGDDMMIRALMRVAEGLRALQAGR